MLSSLTCMYSVFTAPGHSETMVTPLFWSSCPQSAAILSQPALPAEKGSLLVYVGLTNAIGHIEEVFESPHGGDVDNEPLLLFHHEATGQHCAVVVAPQTHPGDRVRQMTTLLVLPIDSVPGLRGVSLPELLPSGGEDCVYLKTGIREGRFLTPAYALLTRTSSLPACSWPILWKSFSTSESLEWSIWTVTGLPPLS